jgi:hypothetical protein
MFFEILVLPLFKILNMKLNRLDKKIYRYLKDIYLQIFGGMVKN